MLTTSNRLVAPDNHLLSLVFDNIISTLPPFMLTFRRRSSPAPESISFATPTGMVVLSVPGNCNLSDQNQN
jgi:hypothetical protein